MALTEVFDTINEIAGQIQCPEIRQFFQILDIPNAILLKVPEGKSQTIGRDLFAPRQRVQV